MMESFIYIGIALLFGIGCSFLIVGVALKHHYDKIERLERKVNNLNARVD